MDELSGRSRRRLLVFDSAPLLVTTESHVLASHMGQVVMMVAAGRTRQEAVTSAVQSLNEFQFVGLVLNMSRLPPTEDYFKRNYHPRVLKEEV